MKEKIIKYLGLDKEIARQVEEKIQKLEKFHREIEGMNWQHWNDFEEKLMRIVKEHFPRNVKQYPGTKISKLLEKTDVEYK